MGQGRPPGTTVFVGNISYDTTEEELREVFSQVGTVVSFRLLYDSNTGRAKGYGFCEYEDKETAMSARRNLNGTIVNNRPLRVDHTDSDKQFAAANGLALPQNNTDNAPNSPVADSANTTNQSNPSPGVNVNNSLPSNRPQTPTTQAQAHPLLPSALNNANPTMAFMSLPDIHQTMVHLKRAVVQNPNDMRELLAANPRLAHAILQGQIMLGMIPPPLMPPPPGTHVSQDQPTTNIQPPSGGSTPASAGPPQIPAPSSIPSQPRSVPLPGIPIPPSGVPVPSPAGAVPPPALPSGATSQATQPSPTQPNQPVLANLAPRIPDIPRPPVPNGPHASIVGPTSLGQNMPMPLMPPIRPPPPGQIPQLPPPPPPPPSQQQPLPHPQPQQPPQSQQLQQPQPSRPQSLPQVQAQAQTQSQAQAQVQAQAQAHAQTQTQQLLPAADEVADEQAAVLSWVMSLTPQGIEDLQPEQRQYVLQLKEIISKNAQAM